MSLSERVLDRDDRAAVALRRMDALGWLSCSMRRFLIFYRGMRLGLAVMTWEKRLNISVRIYILS